MDDCLKAVSTSMPCFDRDSGVLRSNMDIPAFSARMPVTEALDWPNGKACTGSIQKMAGCPFGVLL